MFCRQCGGPLREGAAFCPGCGAPVAAPEVPAPAVFDVPTAPPVAAEVPARSMLPLIGLALAGLAIFVGVGFGVYTLLRPAPAEDIAATPQPKATGSGSATSDAEPESSDAESADDAAADELPTDAESYELLVREYEKLGEISDSIGKARDDGVYGGTGFAYDVFNTMIGNKDRAVRQELIGKCEDEIDRVSAERQALADMEVAESYEQQKDDLLALYDLLDKRLQALRDTAEYAVDHPKLEQYRSRVLKNREYRQAFDEAYPNAMPHEL